MFRTIAAITLAMTISLALAANSDARPLQPEPMLRPVGLLQAQKSCPSNSSITECRAALRRALAAISWQKSARANDATRLLNQTRGKQPYAYAANLAYLACRTFSTTPQRCRPASEMLHVGRCESGLQSHDPNPSSSADGWMQFLAGTWNRSTAGQLGYSRFDVLAMGIATAGIVHSDGSWREWVCAP